jgi:hypothetical protein
MGAVTGGRTRLVCQHPPDARVEVLVAAPPLWMAPHRRHVVTGSVSWTWRYASNLTHVAGLRLPGRPAPAPSNLPNGGDCTGFPGRLTDEPSVVRPSPFATEPDVPSGWVRLIAF